MEAQVDQDADGNRDIIIVTGCNAVGKTTASYYLRESISRFIACESRFIADSQFLLDAMLQDDMNGGKQHTHDWCLARGIGHIHAQGQPRFPFTITDNTLPDEMRTNFFNHIAALPQTGKLWFVEWAAGENRNTGTLSNIDYSYAASGKVIRQVQKMQEKEKVTPLLSRVRAVVHIEAEMTLRSTLNKCSALPRPLLAENIRAGTAFWQKDETVLQFYGEDDFSASQIESLFRKKGSHIYHIRNNGTESFFEELENNVVAPLCIVDEIVAVSDDKHVEELKPIFVAYSR